MPINVVTPSFLELFWNKRFSGKAVSLKKAVIVFITRTSVPKILGSDSSGYRRLISRKMICEILGSPIRGSDKQQPFNELAVRNKGTNQFFGAKTGIE